MIDLTVATIHDRTALIVRTGHDTVTLEFDIDQTDRLIMLLSASNQRARQTIHRDAARHVTGGAA